MDTLCRTCADRCAAARLFRLQHGGRIGLIGIYTLGFVLPFLAVGLFTDRLLALFQRHQKAMRITVRAGGVLLILIGVMMFTGWMNGITGYLSSFGGTGTANSSVSSSTVVSGEVEKKEENSATSEGSASQSAADNLPDAPDFTLTDQFGNTHTLSDYEERWSSSISGRRGADPARKRCRRFRNCMRIMAEIQRT